MHKVDQIHIVHRKLRQARYPVPRAALREALGCSRATLTRVIQGMRDYLDAPIEYDRERSGYYYSDERFEIPGLWFRADEIAAVAALLDVTDRLEAGLLHETLAPFEQHLASLAERYGVEIAALRKRLRVLRLGGRPLGRHFRTVADATLRRKRLDMVYHARAQDAQSERQVSPQRLVRYRDNWYLDAWCHRRKGLRSFAVERIHTATLVDTPATEISEDTLDQTLAGAYGIFSGEPDKTAVIDFTPERARWVAEETWHPEQKGEWLDDGQYRLHLPYLHDEELVMDILKYGPDATVVAPDELREAVGQRLAAALENYE